VGAKVSLSGSNGNNGGSSGAVGGNGGDGASGPGISLDFSGGPFSINSTNAVGIYAKSAGGNGGNGDVGCGHDHNRNPVYQLPHD
jgi:hypothetical protein